MTAPRWVLKGRPRAKQGVFIAPAIAPEPVSMAFQRVLIAPAIAPEPVLMAFRRVLIAPARVSGRVLMAPGVVIRSFSSAVQDPSFAVGLLDVLLGLWAVGGL